MQFYIKYGTIYLSNSSQLCNYIIKPLWQEGNTMYNKVLVEIGKLEVRFEEDSRVITELSNFRDKICSDDILQGAIAFGRLQARIGETTEEI